MANFPCDSPLVICAPGQEAERQATRNFSSESPDRFTWFGVFQCAIDATNPAYSICESVESQRAADICSALCLPDTVFVNSAQTCSNPCGAVTIPAGQFLGFSQANADQLAHAYACAALGALCLVGNAAQSCTMDCPGGGSQTYTVEAGTIFSTTAQNANTQAMNLACLGAAALCFGPLEYNTEQSCQVQCANGAFVSYTIAAGIVAGVSVEEANAQAEALACTLAMLSCDSLPPIVGNTTQTCTQDCDGQPVTYTVLEGAFLALTQGDADNAAFAYACAVLSGACQRAETPPAMNVGNTMQDCTVNCASGGTFTAIVRPGTFRGANLAIANAAAASYACSLVNGSLFCLDSIPSQVCRDSVYAAVISTASAPMAVTSGSLPPGLTISGGMIAGVPTLEGTYEFTILALGTNGYTQRSYTIVVAGFITATLPAGTVGTPYNQSIVVSGFSNPFFSVSGGTLPDGLTLNPSTGAISGTPTTAGDSAFVISVSEGADNPSVTCVADYSITIVSASLFHIPDYGGATPLFTPPVTANASALPEWDGRYYFNNAGFSGFTNAYTPSTDPDTPAYSDQGKELYRVFIGGPNAPTGFIPETFWTLTIQSQPTFPDFGRVWQGYKVGGDTSTPVGVYVRGDLYIPQNMSDPRADVTVAAG